MDAALLLIPAAAIAAAGVASARSGGASIMPNSQPNAPTLPQIPARALTIDQAKAILAQMVADKTIGAVTDSPLAPVGTRVTLPSTIAGVSFQYQGHPIEIHDVDARFAVLLVRFAAYLSNKYGILVLRHLGIYPGNPAAPNDVHNQGRAIDVAGVAGGSIGDLDVARDWGAQPAPWSADATVTGYRLPVEDQPAHNFFMDLYSFFAREGSDRTAGYVADEGPPTQIGNHGYVVTPDHPDPKLRAAHQNHVHAQIGPTRI